MSKEAIIVKARINLSKLDQSKFWEDDNGNKWVTVDVLASNEPDKFGKNAHVKEVLSMEEVTHNKNLGEDKTGMIYPKFVGSAKVVYSTCGIRKSTK